MRIILLLLGLPLLLVRPAAAAETAQAAPPVAQIQPDATLPKTGPSVDQTLLTSEMVTSNLVGHLTPGPDDAPISQLVARVLQRFEYRQQPFDDTISSNFLYRYVSDLDPQHLHFLQSDLDEFAHYSSKLDDLTLRYGDTSPAYEIFNRFLERLQQRTAYAKHLLQTEDFTFTNDDRVLVNRKDQPAPKDVAAAEKLWRDRLRFEYLQEKLIIDDPIKTNAPATKPKDSPAATGTNAPAATPKTPEQIHDQIVTTLTKRYDRVMRLFTEWDSEEVFQFYLTTLAHVYDPHSDYFDQEQLQEFSMQMNLSLFGIGALLTTDDDGYCKIKEIKPGPAMKSGKLKTDDRIIAVAQGDAEPVDVVNMPLNKVVQLIRGPKGSEVRLTIIPANADLSTHKVVSLIRDEIKLDDQAAKAKIIEMPDGKGGTTRLGVIDLPAFYATFDVLSSPDKPTARSTTDDVTKLLVKLAEEKVSGVILDLRRNGGGSLEEAIRLTGLFIKKGPVVQVRSPGPDGEIEVDADTDPAQLYKGPLIVLTSRFSASASEIVAGALQDYGRALIVGDTNTHGKGTVQTLNQLGPYLQGRLWTTNDPGALKFTIKKFYRPSGSSTQLKGVKSDIVLPSVDNVADVGETALDYPLPWDTIPSSDFDHLNLVTPYLAELRQRSDARVAKDKDFDYVREDIALYEKARADKTLSLNEAQRLKELKENDARQKAREAERAARKEKLPTVYDISLKQAEQPGLPPAVTETNTVANAAGALDGADADVTDTPAPAPDVDLNETEQIMLDYLQLLATKPAPNAVVQAAK
ncbi:MAG TPA: carboxy terminal-processing peptidase [Dongiaceae bacterium]|nr:carboxy terminal-processing peptidase [Dongiaceae bacterium]